MKMIAALALAAGLTLGATAVTRAHQPGDAKPANTQPADTQPATTKPADTKPAADAKPTDAPAMPANPKAKPVPSDLPVVNKQELEGGLIVEDLKIGEGLEARAGETVVAFYHGTLKSSGAPFDSAFDRGEAATFSLGAVIPGWQKGVPGMKVGGIRRLTIPAALAYGPRSHPPRPPYSGIPANSDLVFVIQLEDVLRVETQDVTVGTGEQCSPQAIWVTAFTVSDQNGKVLDKATREEPYVWLPGEWPAMESVLNGMKVGGKRKAQVPASMNSAQPGAPVSERRPAGVPLNIEVEVLCVRNLPPKPRP